VLVANEPPQSKKVPAGQPAWLARQQQQHWSARGLDVVIQSTCGETLLHQLAGHPAATYTIINAGSLLPML
jgi:hypothetical protein